MTQTQEKAPGCESKGLVNLASTSVSNTAGFRVDGAVVIDLRVSGGPYGDNDHIVARKIQHAALAPAGVDVTFIVSARQTPPAWAIAYLRAEGAHLKSVKVQSDCPDTISTWWTALRGESN